ncbi:MAG: 50S ribosomal protein L24 [Bacteroidetes bacterium]|nr:50S ribosomal protein L24 [Bacteroidota bacterium]
MHIRRGDTVKVLSGDDKNKTGKVLEILREKDRAIVEGVNIVTKHQKPSAGKPEGGIKKIEAGIHLSNLMLIDPSSGKPTRTGRKLNEKGKLQRYSKKTGELIK